MTVFLLFFCRILRSIVLPTQKQSFAPQDTVFFACPKAAFGANGCNLTRYDGDECFPARHYFVTQKCLETTSVLFLHFSLSLPLFLCNIMSVSLLPRWKRNVSSSTLFHFPVLQEVASWHVNRYFLGGQMLLLMPSFATSCISFPFLSRGFILGTQISQIQQIFFFLQNLHKSRVQIAEYR